MNKPMCIAMKQGEPLPEGAVCVAFGEWWKLFKREGLDQCKHGYDALELFAGYLETESGRYLENLFAPLKGKDLACWDVMPGRRSHAEVLLHYVNRPVVSELAKYLGQRFRTLWGAPCHVEPRLLDKFWGDGRQVMTWSPTMDRPNYYVVRIDSQMATDDDAFYDFIDTIWDELEDQFGPQWVPDDDGEVPDEPEPWPAVNTDGVSWGSVVFEVADLRSEDEVMEELRVADYCLPEDFFNIPSGHVGPQDGGPVRN